MSEYNAHIDNLLSSISDSLSEIQNNFDAYQVANFPERTPQFFCLELNGEAGELANDEKKIWKGREILKEKLAEEAADVFIALMNYVNSRKLNLQDSVIIKIKKNEEMRKERAEKGLEY
ncbi:MAG: hypothetical protein A2X64_00860 [Ignavibacteria bacterium GWF2_33_9]|nr:MAG: hypothetical protein A2X64_00860 [Ignavibacteria bacterium GWF2_33_9]